MELLSRSGVDPNIQSTSMRRSALHEAVGTNSYEIVAILVARKGDINLKDSDGNSPLHIAVNDGSHRLL